MIDSENKDKTIIGVKNCLLEIVDRDYNFNSQHEQMITNDC